jgi:hypothetical protein
MFHSGWVTSVLKKQPCSQQGRGRLAQCFEEQSGRWLNHLRRDAQVTPSRKDLAELEKLRHGW